MNHDIRKTRIGTGAGKRGFNNSGGFPNIIQRHAHHLEAKKNYLCTPKKFTIVQKIYRVPNLVKTFQVLATFLDI